MTILMVAVVLSVLAWSLYEYRAARTADVFSYLPLILDIKDRDADRFECELRAARDHSDA